MTIISYMQMSLKTILIALNVQATILAAQLFIKMTQGRHQILLLASIAKMQTSCSNEVFFGKKKKDKKKKKGKKCCKSYKKKDGKMCKSCPKLKILETYSFGATS